MKNKRFFASLLVIAMLLTMVAPITVTATEGLPQPGDQLLGDLPTGGRRQGLQDGYNMVETIVYGTTERLLALDRIEVVIHGNALEFVPGQSVLIYENGHRVYPTHEIFADGERLTFFIDHSQTTLAEMYARFRSVVGTVDTRIYIVPFLLSGRSSSPAIMEGYPAEWSVNSPYRLTRQIGVGSVMDVFYPSDQAGGHTSTPPPRPGILQNTPQPPIIGAAVNQQVTVSPEPPIHGSDIASEWALEGIRRAHNLGLIPTSLFAFPTFTDYTLPITRAEFTALAVTLYEKQHGQVTGRVQFTDTNDIKVQKAAYLGIVQGVGNNRFDPNAQLTREQAAVMLSRLADVMENPLPRQAATFADNSAVSSWAIDAVGHVQTAGIMGGVGDNRFDPQGAYTREQSIITILRLFDLG